MTNFSKASDEDKKWMGRSDAYTLAEGEVIKADKQRYQNAIHYAKELAEEGNDNIKAMNKVAGKKGISLVGKGCNPATVMKL